MGGRVVCASDFGSWGTRFESLWKQNSLNLAYDCTVLHCTEPLIVIALDKMFFFNKKILKFFLFLLKNICCGYSLKAPGRGASNEYPQHVFSWRNKKNTYLIPTLIKTYDYHPSIILIWLKWYWKEHKPPTHHHYKYMYLIWINMPE